MNGEENKEAAQLETKVEVLENGPLLVYGTLKVTDKEGNTDTKRFLYRITGLIVTAFGSRLVFPAYKNLQSNV